MFQHFKNIFPTTLPLRPTGQEGSQETEWKTRGLERLEAIKSELQQWQGISQHPPPSATDTAAFVPFPEATRQCIERTQQQWTSIHDRNQSNLQKATLADRRVGHLLQQCEAHGRVSHRLEATQQEALSLQTQCDALTHMATQLHETLIGLEEQIQQRWTEKRQRDYTLWQQQQTSDLLREEKEREQRLVQKEAQLRATWEEHSQQQKKERIALYDATFQAELEEYRHKRETQVDSLYSVPTLEVDKTTDSLETLKLEVEDEKDLSHFLEDSDKRQSNKETSDSSVKKLAKNNTTDEWKSKPESELSDEEDRIEILEDEDYED